MLSFPQCKFPTSNALVAVNICPLIARRTSVPETAESFSPATISPA